MEIRLLHTDETRRNELKIEFEKFLGANLQIYIYGAGIVGKRLYRVIENMKFTENIAGFIVSDRSLETPEILFDKRVFELSEIDNKESSILIAVSEAYQNEILYILKEAGYYHFVNGYIYSYLCEEYIPEYMPLEVPDIIAIDKNELMMMQFNGDDFLRYDLLAAIITSAYKPVHGSDEYRIIIVDSLFRICDNVDKVAVYLRSADEKVKIKRDFKVKLTVADRKWLIEQEDSKETEMIERVLKEKIAEWKKAMYAIIWPPAKALADRVVEEMQETVEVVEWLDIVMDQEEFTDFVKAVYSTDDVEEWQIHAKLSRMIKKDECEVRIVKFYLDHPKFRIKRFGHTISGAGMEMKEGIRNRHKNEMENYIKDIIIHTTDNYEQAYLVAKIVDSYLEKGNKKVLRNKTLC